MTALQKTLTYTQLNNASCAEVFPLLCPVREKDWLDGWEYEMIYSQSGLVEQDCVFSTPMHGEFDTIWQVITYEPQDYVIEFLRVTPKENVVRIHIYLEKMDDNHTFAHISYTYTALNENSRKYIKEQLPSDFQKSMIWWERSINHYLKTGYKLLKEDA